MRLSIKNSWIFQVSEYREYNLCSFKYDTDSLCWIGQKYRKSNKYKNICTAKWRYRKHGNNWTVGNAWYSKYLNYLTIYFIWVRINRISRLESQQCLNSRIFKRTGISNLLYVALLWTSLHLLFGYDVFLHASNLQMRPTYFSSR